MLTPQDDLIGHQTPAAFASRPGGGDPRFTERYWYTAHPIDGTPILFDAGFGYYPNRGVMDAFAGVTVGRRQINFRASRHLGANPLTPEVGGLKFEVLEGMKAHRLSLAPGNGSGIAFELVFEARFPAAQEKQNYRERDGQVEEDLARVAQFGRYRGWIEVEGTRHVVEPATWWGQRDHSWGIRSPQRTDEYAPPVAAHRHFLWTWSMFQFEDMAISIFLKERAPGRAHYLSGTEYSRVDGVLRHREMTAARHEIVWQDDPLGQSIAHADWTFEFDSGAPRALRMECLPTRFYLKGGMYGGFKGWNHGDDKGPLHTEHDVWDLEDARTRELARTLSDHVIRATTDGKVGHGVSEYGVAAGYPLYTAPQRFAAI